jgi:hypothetical protein
MTSSSCLTHKCILLDEKLKGLALQRRWKEYNSYCSLFCNSTMKTDHNKLRNFIEQGLLENLENTCALCLC